MSLNVENDFQVQAGTKVAGKVWATTRATGCCPTTNQSLPRNFLQVPVHHHLPEKSTIEWRIARKKI